MRLAATALFLLVGCVDYGFESPSEVNGPRLLAVIAEPPELNPGTEVELTAMTANPFDQSLTFRWSVDLSPRALAASAGQVFDSATERNLTDEGPMFRIAAEETSNAIDDLMVELGDPEPGSPESVVRTVYDRVGLEARVECSVYSSDGALLVTGFKRIILTPRATLTTNPPSPRFTIGGVVFRTTLDDPTRCVPEGDAPTIAAGSVTTFEPDDDLSWLETYPALDLEGEPFLGVENAYFAWFATAGSFSFDITRAPNPTVEWTAPEAPGAVRGWLVVRDGHLGTSGCELRVDVF